MKRSTKFLTAISLSTMVLTSCADLFESRISMLTNGNISNLTSLVVPEVTIDQLDAPAQIFVSQAESSTKINISWSKVDGATSYYLERAVSTAKDVNGRFICPEESEFKPMPIKRIYATSYEDTILTNPSYSSEEYSFGYFYRVCAENPRLKYESSEYKLSEVAYLLAPPSGVKASRGESTTNIKVTWNKVPGAKYYDIYYSESDTGSGAQYITTINANQNWYNDVVANSLKGKDLYYSVYAKTSANTSVSSALALGYTLQEGAPPQVTGVVVENSRGNTTDKITIKWNPAGDFDYAVYRTSSKDASFTLLRKDGKTNSFTDSKALKPNVYYYYQIQAFKVEGDTKVKGPFSDSGTESKTPAEAFLLVPPSNITVMKNKLDASRCTITFPPVIGSKDYSQDSGLTSDYNNYTYVIYGCDTADGAFTEVGSFDDSTLSKDANGNYSIPITTRNYYKVTTKNGSAESNESEVCAPAPFAASNLECSRAANVGGDANINGVLPVKITWASPKNDVAEGGYYVYRSTNPDSGFKKITDEALMTTSFIDNYDAAKAGVYYYYKVLSLNSLGQGSNYTDAVVGYGALTADQYMREYNKTVMASQKKLKLMHIADDMKKLGKETINGKICGTLSYNAAIDGLGARILMHYTDYAEFYANGDAANGYYFFLNGDTNTSASMDASGNMDGIVTIQGMYPGSISYNNIKIKGGGAAGGSYGIKREGFDGQIEVDWKVGEEGK
ncbi:MAG: hypothetical protein MJ184_01195 [Treponema sp.]|uniref:hypothetical protein n=1 Tax=Treponema sp. TaxID=166 RepID=UPI00298DCF25|nr:hypothetical protein [Treponema sp.]MCQ2599960.1 hypothetical protein [Treponema sp.]